MEYMNRNGLNSRNPVNSAEFLLIGMKIWKSACQPVAGQSSTVTLPA